MTRKLRVGIVGAGIAERHLAGFDWIKDLYEVVVLCSLDEERGRKLCDQYAIPEYTQDVDTLFRRDDLDLIDICTPPDSHFDLSRRGIEAGKHIICEKPLFGSIAEVDEMAGIVARANGPKLMPIFQYRYGTGLQKLKMLIEKGLTAARSSPRSRRIGGAGRPITTCPGAASGSRNSAAACSATRSTPMTC